MRGRLAGAPERAPRLPAQAAGRARAAARRSARGRSATQRAWRTGAPAAREERARRGVTKPRGRARSAPLSLAARLRARRLPAVRRRGRAVRVRAARVARDGRRSTSTARSCARSSRRARRRSRSARTRGSRSRSCAREPAARIFARAHAGRRASEDDALFRTVVLPLLSRPPRRAAASTGTTRAFDRAYAELERSLFGKGHAYAAVAPLVGISVGTRSTSATGCACATPRPASSPRTGPRRRACCRRTSAARPTASRSSSSSAACARASRSRPTRPASSPTP